MSVIVSFKFHVAQQHSRAVHRCVLGSKCFIWPSAHIDWKQMGIFATVIRMWLRPCQAPAAHYPLPASVCIHVAYVCVTTTWRGSTGSVLGRIPLLGSTDVAHYSFKAHFCMQHNKPGNTDGNFWTLSLQHWSFSSLSVKPKSNLPKTRLP